MEKGLSTSKIKFIRSLSVNKYRKKYQCFITEGPKIVHEMLNSSFRVREILALPSWLEGFGIENIGNKTPLTEITSRELKKISNLQTPNQALAVVEMPDAEEPDDLPADDLILVLDDVSDPGNLGTIIRTADWFGIDNIVCSQGCVDVFNPKVVQATMGSIARVKVSYVRLFDFLKKHREVTPVYATVKEGKSIYETKLSSGALILIGNESRGLDPKLTEMAHHQISIPPVFKDQGKGHSESLNASVAAGIICSEFRRR